MKRPFAIIIVIVSVCVFLTGMIYVLTRTMHAGKEPPSSIITNEDWTAPTGDFTFIPETLQLTPRESEAEDKEFTIKTDSYSFTVLESSLASYDVFTEDEYLQAQISEYFYDIPVVYHTGTHKYENGVMSIEVDGYDGGTMLFTIDTNKGEMNLEMLEDK